MQPQTALTHAPQTGLSLLATRASSLAPYLANSASELAVGIMAKFSQLSFTSARQSAQVSGLIKTDPDLADDTAEALGNLIVFTAAQFNVGNNLSDAQAALLANDLLAAYWHWRFDEFAYLMGQALRGKWGTVYNRIDQAVVYEWCEKYSVERETLLTAESEQQAQAYKLAEKSGKPTQEPPTASTATPQGRALRQQLASLSTEQLQAGLDYYAALPDPTPEQALKLAVAIEEGQERNRVAWATHMLRRSKDGAGLTQSERAQQARQQDHALGVALLRGDWAGAGFTTEPSAAWLAMVQAPENEPMPAPASWPSEQPHQVFPAACPSCCQRPDQCVCPSLSQKAA